MKSLDIIKDLGINYLSCSAQMPHKYYLLNEKIDNAITELKTKLPKGKDKKKLDQLLEMTMENCSMECDERFTTGFILAAHIMIEAFTYKFD